MLKTPPHLDCPSPKNSQEKPKTTDIPASFEKSTVPPANSVLDENIDFPNFQNSSPKPTLTEEKIASEERDEDLTSQEDLAKQINSKDPLSLNNLTMPPHVQSFGTSVPLYPELSHRPKLAQAITSRKLVNHDLTYFNPDDMRKQKSNSFGQYYGDINDVDDSTTPTVMEAVAVIEENKALIAKVKGLD